MAWSDDLRAQVLEEFRCAQRVRGGIVERDTKPENVLTRKLTEASISTLATGKVGRNQKAATTRDGEGIAGNPDPDGKKSPPRRRRRIVGAAA